MEPIEIDALSLTALPPVPPPAPLNGPVLRADDLLQRAAESYGLTVNARGELVLSRGAEVSGL